MSSSSAVKQKRTDYLLSLSQRDAAMPLSTYITLVVEQVQEAQCTRVLLDYVLRNLSLSIAFHHHRARQGLAGVGPTRYQTFQMKVSRRELSGDVALPFLALSIT